MCSSLYIFAPISPSSLHFRPDFSLLSTFSPRFLPPLYIFAPISPSSQLFRAISPSSLLCTSPLHRLILRQQQSKINLHFICKHCFPISFDAILLDSSYASANASHGCILYVMKNSQDSVFYG